ncbi:hypothetical protein OSTOST_16532, partial [Ostertagia ostertagi]
MDKGRQVTSHFCKEGDEGATETVDIERLRRCIIEFVKERGVLLMELVTIVHEASYMCVEGLALTADFTLRTIMDPQKWIFIEENIPLMDYKGVRSLFKCLIYQQFNSIPAQLSPEQRRQLLPAERILLKILDPDLNVIPPIFTLTELSRGILKRAYMFPRLAHRLSELIMYFRAVAELSYVIGRCFLFPLPAHPSFTASAASCRIDHLTTQI